MFTIVKKFIVVGLLLTACTHSIAMEEHTHEKRDVHLIITASINPHPSAKISYAITQKSDTAQPIITLDIPITINEELIIKRNGDRIVPQKKCYTSQNIPVSLLTKAAQAPDFSIPCTYHWGRYTISHRNTQDTTIGISGSLTLEHENCIPHLPLGPNFCATCSKGYVVPATLKLIPFQDDNAISPETALKDKLHQFIDTPHFADNLDKPDSEFTPSERSEYIAQLATLLNQKVLLVRQRTLEEDSGYVTAHADNGWEMIRQASLPNKPYKTIKRQELIGGKKLKGRF